jgi:hypothetical protein
MYIYIYYYVTTFVFVYACRLRLIAHISNQPQSTLYYNTIYTQCFFSVSKRLKSVIIVVVYTHMYILSGTCYIVGCVL